MAKAIVDSIEAAGVRVAQFPACIPEGSGKAKTAYSFPDHREI